MEGSQLRNLSKDCNPLESELIQGGDIKKRSAVNRIKNIFDRLHFQSNRFRHKKFRTFSLLTGDSGHFPENSGKFSKFPTYSLFPCRVGALYKTCATLDHAVILPAGWHTTEGLERKVHKLEHPKTKYTMSRLYLQNKTKRTLDFGSTMQAIV